MGSTFLSRKQQRLPCRSGAPRWRAPGQERAPGWETRRWVTGLRPTANPAGHCRRSYARPAHAAFPGTRRPSRKQAQCCPRPRAGVARGVSSFADLNLGAAPQREKARSPFKPILPSLPVPGPFTPGALGHPSGRPPENGFASKGSGVDSRERDWSKENWGLQSAAIGEGSEKGASEENQGRVGAPRSQQPVGLQLIANLGWETVVPSEVLHPRATPCAPRARGGAGRNLESQGHRLRVRSVAFPPAPARLRRPLGPALTSGSRSPRRPEAEPQPREPLARPSSASSCGSRSPHGARPAQENRSSSAPRERLGGRGEWVPGVFSE
ncbi:unnamed protein product [Rangifer tarandus platyrhynchus]|uniref:Uncharacterized protein n=2 Tax=Rangifer tarandus platyrhynchus TaxID=3082113 RepID=A0AC59ZN61_RANTA|nr:unnamed protein product [Rangifer tarandus platyrhynchus]